MSIRKPSITSSTTTSTLGGLSDAIPLWSVKELSSGKSFSSSSDVVETPLDTPPAWIREYEGFKSSATEINSRLYNQYNNGLKVIMVKYTPSTTLGVGFVVLHLVDPDSNKRVPQMDAIYKTMCARQSDYVDRGLVQEYNISETGLVRGPFGFPDQKTIVSIVNEMFNYFGRWSEFPNAPDYDTVEALHEAKSKVIAMNREIKDERIKSRIEGYREQIKSAQNAISDLEQSLNSIYEEAADAMNLLEKNGVDVSNAADWGTYINENYTINWNGIDWTIDESFIKIDDSRSCINTMVDALAGYAEDDGN